MSFLKKLTKFGNSSGIIIEKSILEMLDIDLHTPLEISIDNASLVIKPIRKQRTIRDIMHKNFIIYGGTLRKLAE
ncbi:MAG: hypothetical protein KAV87_17255 [Desulfobacteraceae bacterium]|nr:hypothetical protein [Desulfobacteraceae bacterium]